MDVEANDNENLLSDMKLQNYYKNWSSTYLSRIEELKTPMINSFDLKLLHCYRDYRTKYYTDKYCIDCFPQISENIHNDILVRIHSNGIFLIALASGNTIMESPKDISEINFKIKNTDRSKIAFKGKKKYGAKLVKKETTICQVKLEGEPDFYNIRAGVQGLLVEFNEQIKTNPNVIKTDPKGIGYICMILPKVSSDKIKETVDNLDLLVEEEYLEYLSKRRKEIHQNE